MTLHQLKNRQQTLLNLIANVGGKQNIRKWMDELMVIDSQIEEIEAEMTAAIQIVFDDQSFEAITQPWVIMLGGKEVERFSTYARCERFLAWKGLSAA
jgi:hypothetical protein